MRNLLSLLALLICLPAGATSIELAPNEFVAPRPNFWQRLNPLPWIPEGERRSVVSATCDPSQLERMAPTAENFQDFVRRCEPELKAAEPSGLHVLVDLASNAYQNLSNPYVRPVTIRLDNGLLFRGHLGLKPGSGRRPLVVALCGLFCNAEDPMAATFIAQLFEEAPFHVLVLGNPTASAFAKDNQIPALGGYMDGQNLLEISRFLRGPRSPIAARVSSLHLVGQSLGSQGVLYASLLDSQRAARGQARAVQSAIAVCPVIDLRGTLEYLQRDAGPVANLIYKDEISTYLRSSFDSMPLLRDRLDPRRSYSLDEYIRIFVGAAVDYQAARPQASGVRTLDDFWIRNDFFRELSSLTTPTLVLNADNDFLVSPAANSLRLPAHPHLGLVRFKDGSHCGMAISSGWETLTRMMRAYVLGHSPEFRAEPARAAAIPAEAARGPWWARASLFEGERVRKVDWDLNAEGRTLKLVLTIGKAGNAHCERALVPAEAQDCFRRGEVRLDLDTIPELAPLAGQLDRYARSRVLRWLRTQVSVLDERGQPVVESGLAPASLLVAPW